MHHRRAAAGLAAFILAIGAAGAALAAVPPGTLDQSHECAAGTCNSQTSDGTGVHPDAEYPLWYSGNGNNGANVGLGQTFTAGIGGTLTGVELYLNRLDATTPSSLTIQIESTANGVPSGTVLASATVATSAIGTSPGWVGVTFATPATVAAGTKYAITLPELPQQDVQPWLVWGLDSTATAAYTDYAGGDAYASVAGAWDSLIDVLTDGGTGTADLGFRTYVQAAAVATPTPPTATPTVPPTDTAPTVKGDTGTGGWLALLGTLALAMTGSMAALRLAQRRQARR